MEYYSIDSLIKIIALLTSISVLFFKLNEFSINKKATRRADYEFSEKFLSEDKWKLMPDYLLEKGYLAISGKQLLAADIRFLFNTHNPLSKFQLFERAEKYLTISVEDDIRTLTYKNEYTSKRLKNMERKNFFGYFITAIFSAFPAVFLGDIIKIWGVNGLWTSLIWSTPFGFIAYSYLREHWNLSAAEYIVNQSWREKKPQGERVDSQQIPPRST